MAKTGLTFRQRSWVTACWLHLRVCNNMMWKDIVRSRGDEPRLYIVTENRDEDRDTGAILVASIFKHHPWVWANLTSPPMASNTHTHTHFCLQPAFPSDVSPHSALLCWELPAGLFCQDRRIGVQRPADTLSQSTFGHRGEKCAHFFRYLSYLRWSEHWSVRSCHLAWNSAPADPDMLQGGRGWRFLCPDRL